MTSHTRNAVLLVGLGATGRLSDVRPFLENIVKGRAVPKARIDEVYAHYQAVGGSPYNGSVRLQAKALEQELTRRELAMPIYVGMRNWKPYLTQVFDMMTADEIDRAVTVILAPHEGKASTERYREAVERAQRHAGLSAPQVEYVAPWYASRGFTQAIVDRIVTATSAMSEAEREGAAWIFTAHSIPLSLADGTPYEEQCRATVDSVCRELGVRNPVLAYQSRSGAPEDAWLEPDVGRAIEQAAADGHSAVVVTPVGFLNDHVEVLYDLDVDAAQVAARCCIPMVRPKTVGDHPRFIRLLADSIEQALPMTRAGSIDAA